MSKRPKIEFGMSMQDMIATMSEGNPGGLTTMMKLIEHAGSGPGLMLVLDLDDMNMRGPQIWVGYKYYCDGDIAKFAKAVRARDPKLVRFVNEEEGMKDFEHRAVTSGGSFS